MKNKYQSYRIILYQSRLGGDPNKNYNVLY